MKSCSPTASSSPPTSRRRIDGKEIAHGNGKVVRARLSDALYFWKTDQGDLPDLDQLEGIGGKDSGSTWKKPLDQRMARLDHLGVTFHAKLGTQGERVERIARLAEELAPIVARSGKITPPGPSGHPPHRGEGAASSLAPSSPSMGEVSGQRPDGGGDTLAALARRAAVLAKADLTTEIVGEFPELQGAMGRKYALLQGEHPSVAAAIEEHYKPQGPGDRVPTDPVSVAVALADKLDTLVGFWAIDEKPTGSKDPYALRQGGAGGDQDCGGEWGEVEATSRSLRLDHDVCCHDAAKSVLVVWHAIRSSRSTGPAARLRCEATRPVGSSQKSCPEYW